MSRDIRLRKYRMFRPFLRIIQIIYHCPVCRHPIPGHMSFVRTIQTPHLIIKLPQPPQFHRFDPAAFQRKFCGLLRPAKRRYIILLCDDPLHPGHQQLRLFDPLLRQGIVLIIRIPVSYKYQFHRIVPSSLSISASILSQERRSHHSATASFSP